MSPTARILLVDDDAMLLQALPEAIRLRLEDVEVDTAESAALALERLAETDYDAVVTDIKMPGLDGLGLLARIRDLRPEIPTLLITGHGEHDLTLRALRGGAYDFIQKPIDRDYFIVSLQRAIDARRLRRKVEEQRQQLQTHASELEDVVEERTRDLRFLSDASRALVASLDLQGTLDHLTQLAVPALADGCVVDLADEDGNIYQTAVHHTDDTVRALLAELRRRYPLHRIPGHPVTRALRSGEPEVFEAVSEDELAIRAIDEEHLRLMLAIRTGSQIVIPLTARTVTAGVISFIRGADRPGFTVTDLPLLEDLARRAALAVDNARLYDREHRIAETFQRAFLPPALPAVPGVDLSAAYTPGSLETEIGGDWYDAFRLPDGRLVVSVGDVAGKGLQAAVKMSQVREAIRATMFQASSPAEPLEVAHRVLSLDDAPQMTTAIVGVLDSAAKTFTYSSAGHAGPILASPLGDVASLPSMGIALGSPLWRAPQVRQVDLIPGSTLVLYTDGLVEHRHDIIAGEQALRDVVRAVVDEQVDLPAQAIQDRVLAGGRHPDDIAVLVVQVTQLPAPRLDLTLPAVPDSFREVITGVGQLAERLRLDSQQAFGLKVAVGEAVSNVIEHAYVGARGSFTVNAVQTDHELSIKVRDMGRWRTWRPEGRGRGLRIMRALAGSVEIDTDNAGTTLTIRVPLRGAQVQNTVAGGM
ncbi:MAG TPA: SpoIIE family protein phosphatase [bacterium]|jgi:FixJ family two-component response regulator/anti-sigma regulatory factor (Ser/Thr protein kinase)|nr:SpoIIE family protein phosphatase [bacterium]